MTRSRIEAGRERLLTELTDYCAIPSVSAQGQGLEEAARWVADRLEALGARVRYLRRSDAPPLIFAEIGPPEGTPTLLIYNHYDVQPPEPLSAWESPPFEPTVRDGRIFARGVADNKANFLSRVHALDAMAAAGRPFGGRILWLIEGEEEVGSAHLDDYADEHGGLWSAADGCLWEAGYKDEAGRMILYAGCKGLASFELHVRTATRDAHSAYATLLPNAAWRMVEALASLRGPTGEIAIAGVRELAEQPTPQEEALLAQIPFEPESMLASYGVGLAEGLDDRSALRRHIFSPTCTINGIRTGYGGAGTKTVLPAEATAKLDFRLVPGMTPVRVAELLRAHLESQGFADVTATLVAGEHPVRGRVESEVVQAALQACRAEMSVEPALWPHMAATGPMYPVTEQFGIPVVGFGTGYWGSAVHAPNEHVRVDDYFEGIRVAASFFGAFGRR